MLRLMRHIFRAIGWTPLVMLCLLFPPTDAAAQTLSMGYVDQEVYPLLVDDGEAVAPSPGIVVELIQRAVASANGRLTLTRLPAARLYNSIKNGTLNGALCISFAADRAQFMVYPMRDGQPNSDLRCARLRYMLYTKRSSTLQWDGKTLQTAGVVGAHRGFSVVGVLRAAGAQVYEANSDKQLFSMLAADRLAAVAALELVGDQLLAESADAQLIEKLPLALISQDLYMTVNHETYAKQSALVEQVWANIGKFRQATNAELLPKYLR